MNSIHEIFAREFASSRNALIQKLRPSPDNIDARDHGFTEHWPQVNEAFEVMVLVFERDENIRELWAGFIEDVQPSMKYEGKVRIVVDCFRKCGKYDLRQVSDSSFFGKGRGGGSRLKIWRKRESRNAKSSAQTPEGEMAQRLVWVRKNHNKFRDPVWRHWRGVCAVSGFACDSLLVASHIFPWALSSPKEKTDVNNGLLLSVPLDKLFDRGLISFADNGDMLFQNRLSTRTRELFGLPASGARIVDLSKVSKQMRSYLKRHRDRHGF